MASSSPLQNLSPSNLIASFFTSYSDIILLTNKTTLKLFIKCSDQCFWHYVMFILTPAPFSNVLLDTFYRLSESNFIRYMSNYLQTCKVILPIPPDPKTWCLHLLCYMEMARDGTPSHASWIQVFCTLSSNYFLSSHWKILLGFHLLFADLFVKNRMSGANTIYYNWSNLQLYHLISCQRLCHKCN